MYACMFVHVLVCVCACMCEYLACLSACVCESMLPIVCTCMLPIVHVDVVSMYSVCACQLTCGWEMALAC